MKIVVEFEFDESWIEYEDVDPELIIDDAIIELSEGVTFKILKKIPSGEITFDVIEKMVLDHTKFTKEQLNSNTRKWEIVEARWLCHYLSRKYKLGSYALVGLRFGNKDSKSARNGYLKVQAFLKNNNDFKIRNKIFIESFK